MGTFVGTFVGMLFHTVYKDSERLGNVRQMDHGERSLPAAGKLAPVSKIARCVGTLSNRLSGCMVMELHGC